MTLFCSFFSQINWLWYIIATVLAYAIGAVWYSVFFSKTWMTVFKIDMPQEMSMKNAAPTMIFQFLATALLGLVFFVLTKISVCLALFALIGFVVWRIAGLKFQFSNCKVFFTATIIEVGYMAITCMVFILFALL